MTISRPLYVYLARPDTGEWVTVGRYQHDEREGVGRFRYAPSYVEAGLAWSIDPVNLPFRPELEWTALRYGGLHDVLRDASPDAWGQTLLRREYGLAEDTAPVRYLSLAGNTDRWGALAVGMGRKPSSAELASPRLPQLAALVEELGALSEQRPAIHASLRRRLVQTASVGGARPKTTVRDPEGRHWLVKPRLASDPADIPALEHACRLWGSGSGLRFASTELHPGGAGRSAVRVLRFDREQGRRLPCLSAASLLQVEYPGAGSDDRWSYPRLAEELRRIGAPEEDRLELFGRMIFNALCGNDDDHVRNHAVVYRHSESGWRLSPAFDVVPNPVETPRRLAMQLSAGSREISREAVLADAHRFGLNGRETAARFLDALLERIRDAFPPAVQGLEPEWQEMLHARMKAMCRVLSNTR